jgi:hypothetical protein
MEVGEKVNGKANGELRCSTLLWRPRDVVQVEDPLPEGSKTSRTISSGARRRMPQIAIEVLLGRGLMYSRTIVEEVAKKALCAFAKDPSTGVVSCKSHPLLPTPWKTPFSVPVARATVFSVKHGVSGSLAIAKPLPH